MAGKEKLSALAVATAKPGRYCDGRGLWLRVLKSSAASWLFRFSFDGSVTEMGLGSYPAVSLTEAREARDGWRKVLQSGKNPIEARREAKRIVAGKPTFGECADDLLAAKATEWRSEKHRAQWAMTLTEYAKPLRVMPVDQVDTDAVLAVLTPLWQATRETASRLRGRIEAVLDAARVKGHIARNEPNPARWRGHLDKALAKRQKLARSHHAAMVYSDVPEFIGRLRGCKGTAALALEFTILTAARTGEVLGAHWAEFDLVAKVWTVPASRMKAGHEHRVPLSDRVLAILERLAELATDDLVFSGQRRGLPLGAMAMRRLAKRLDAMGTIHGFRSSFRDWAGEATSFPREIAEQSLAHATGGAVEAAYRRGDFPERRRPLMEAWASYCDPGAGGNVIPIRAAQ
jgi:integrase